MSATKEENETNVHVMLRIRPNSDEEKKNRYPNVITQVSNTEIKVSNNKKQLPQSDRIFTFDHIFGPQSTQENVFAEAVAPVIEEVLAGYNSTIFAYGQTGTGKTHTMEGSISSNPNDPMAGIIPRCVHTIFQRLQAENTEFNIKVSFLELYKEELTDLASNEDKTLRIYEDVKTGISVQNLDEILVNTPEEVFQLLSKTQQRRHVAETKLNKFSSRSHYIFTMTVHIKDVIDNEELFRTGKLHLVDLAGSECIGRSGAQNERAKEAGRINQSLLSLGRVITALTERQLYIPYRDSKLTRLLQESLGGKSKTSIIATVSPSAICVDESVSTLDYAYRAKSIKNKPQINEKLTQKQYFRDLTKLISRLKSENEALRDKNGIYLPPDQYAELTHGYDEKCNELIEIKQSYNTAALLYTEEKVQHSASEQVLDTINNEYLLTTKRLLQTRACLQQMYKALQNTQQSLREQCIISQEYRLTEEELYNDGTELIASMEDLINDVQGLFAKIQRQNDTETKHIAIINVYQQQCIETYLQMSSILNENGLNLISIEKILSRSLQDLCVICTDYANSEEQRHLHGVQQLLDMNTSRNIMQNELQIQIDTSSKAIANVIYTNLVQSCSLLQSMKSTLLSNLNESNQILYQQLTSHQMTLKEANTVNKNYLNQILDDTQTMHDETVTTLQSLDAVFSSSATKLYDIHASIQQNDTSLAKHTTQTLYTFQQQSKQLETTTTTHADMLTTHIKKSHDDLHDQLANAKQHQIKMQNDLECTIANNSEQYCNDFAITAQHEEQLMITTDANLSTNKTAIDTYGAETEKKYQDMIGLAEATQNLNTKWFDRVSNEMTETQAQSQQLHLDYQNATSVAINHVNTIYQQFEQQVERDGSALIAEMTQRVESFISTQKSSLKSQFNQLLQPHLQSQIVAFEQGQTQHNALFDAVIGTNARYNANSEVAMKKRQRGYADAQNHTAQYVTDSNKTIQTQQNDITQQINAMTKQHVMMKSSLQQSDAQLVEYFTEQNNITQQTIDELAKTTTILHKTANNDIKTMVSTLHDNVTQHCNNIVEYQTKLTTDEYPKRSELLQHSIATIEQTEKQSQQITNNAQKSYNKHHTQLQQNCNNHIVTSNIQHDDIISQLQVGMDTHTKSMNLITSSFEQGVNEHQSFIQEHIHQPIQQNIELIDTNIIQLKENEQLHTKQQYEHQIELKQANEQAHIVLKQQVQNQLESALTSLNEYVKTTNSYNSSFDEQIQMLNKLVTSLAQEKIQPYQNTGQTPIKKQLEYPGALSKTLPTGDIIAQFQQQQQLSQQIQPFTLDTLTGSFNDIDCTEDDDEIIPTTQTHDVNQQDIDDETTPEIPMTKKMYYERTIIEAMPQPHVEIDDAITLPSIIEPQIEKSEGECDESSPASLDDKAITNDEETITESMLCDQLVTARVHKLTSALENIPFVDVQNTTNIVNDAVSALTNCSPDVITNQMNNVNIIGRAGRSTKQVMTGASITTAVIAATTKATVTPNTNTYMPTMVQTTYTSDDIIDEVAPSSSFENEQDHDSCTQLAQESPITTSHLALVPETSTHFLKIDDDSSCTESELNISTQFTSSDLSPQSIIETSKMAQPQPSSTSSSSSPAATVIPTSNISPSAASIASPAAPTPTPPVSQSLPMKTSNLASTTPRMLQPAKPSLPTASSTRQPSTLSSMRRPTVSKPVSSSLSNSSNPTTTTTKSSLTSGPIQPRVSTTSTTRLTAASANRLNKLPPGQEYSKNPSSSIPSAIPRRNLTSSSSQLQNK